MREGKKRKREIKGGKDKKIEKRYGEWREREVEMEKVEEREKSHYQALRKCEEFQQKENLLRDQEGTQ